jgi:hypothetical protein
MKLKFYKWFILLYNHSVGLLGAEHSQRSIKTNLLLLLLIKINGIRESCCSMLCVEDRLSLTQTTVTLDMTLTLTFFIPKNLNTRYVIPPFSKNIL